jgi:16S rRNA (adenine1518-N6/adenine1519-N6)-dimethyltransferase
MSSGQSELIQLNERSVRIIIDFCRIHCELCFTIPPDVFYPKPKVDSAIIKFTKKSNPIVPDEQYVKFNKIVKAAFSKRRKMLRNSLAGFDIPKEIKSEIDFTRRPETLTIQEFAKLLT